MALNNFCGFKTAYLIEREEFPYLEDMLVEKEGEFWRDMGELELPKGWSWTGTDRSGAAGFVLTFDIEGYPHPAQLRKVIRALTELNERYEEAAKERLTVFNSEELEEWSVYEITDEIINAAVKLWYWGGMMGDYGAIAQKLELDSCPAGEVPDWVNPMLREGN